MMKAQCRTILLPGLVLLILLPGPAALSQSSRLDQTVADEELPVGTTGQKLKIQYQSARGRNTRVYRVRNTPHGILTPVRWKDERDVFMDTTLVKCRGDESGEWVETTLTHGESQKGDSLLGYGVNQDEFTEKPTAYVRKYEDKKRKPLTSKRRNGVGHSIH